MKSNVIQFPLQKRGKRIDPITGLIVSDLPEDYPAEYVVVDTYGRGYMISEDKSEAIVFVKKMKLKGVDCFVMEI